MRRVVAGAQATEVKRRHRDVERRIAVCRCELRAKGQQLAHYAMHRIERWVAEVGVGGMPRRPLQRDRQHHETLVRKDRAEVGRFADHRAWMLRSVALAFSIVANRVWLVVIFMVFIPEIYQGAEITSAQLDQAVGLASWLSWVVNLLAVEWWLHRRPRRSANRQQQHTAHRHRGAEALQAP